MAKSIKVVGIGAGKLARHLLPRIQECGHEVIQIYNRHEQAGENLANELGTGYTNDLSSLDKKADLYLLLVSDDVISYVSEIMSMPGALIAHCSGSAPLSEIKGMAVRRSVFYPMVSFSEGGEVDWKETPFLLETQVKKDQVLLETLASSISNKVMFMTSKQRGVLHLSAVISQNFSNHLIGLSKRICEQYNVPFELLMPLLSQSFEKILEKKDPKSLQTGPALRKDVKTIDRHLELLREWPEIREVYRILTASIQNIHRNQ